MEEEMIPKKSFQRKLPYQKTSGKTKNQIDGCDSEGFTRTSRDKKMAEKSQK
jgi:hypothetical protein